ncbi:quaternary amine ABC transporter ATP-binding protein [Alicyclobacillus dauci]|uniref:Quaternary amine transport ATP-binding protein n=1 Tax=Alicyclobacillus dauci TaxID=1475485 RepID=A0ABY6Z114_9BACL|nr:glycine betaine/L-proline ABC transporter ATP-binding protein [Alicyclobacillus dauci]WAH36511.1 glycine betaine/L-proline ABC transporter ATP-binding protein [Alicyclobacillus dauci]
MGEPLIEVREVTKIFGGRAEQALKMLEHGKGKDEVREELGVNVGVDKAIFSIERGELFVIMGLSGSGKSTLLRCLNRLIEPTSGSIVVNGTDITRLNKNDLLKFRQKHMAMVFQSFALLPHRTVAENVAFGLEIQGVGKEERLKRAQEQLAIVGLEGYGDQYPHNLSGGMQQRVGLARALANDTDILLMDEAFSALDPLIRDDMQNELLNLQHKLHKTIVFITHDLNEALKLGDRIALMKDGVVVQTGRPDDIISNPANEYVERFVRGVDLTKVLTAADVMKRPSPLLRVRDGVRVGLRKLNEAGLSSGFVVDEDQHLLGLVSADALAVAISKRLDIVGDCDIQPVTTVVPETNMEDLFHLVVQSNYPLPVVAHDGVLHGLLLKSAILEALASQGGDRNEVSTS